MQQLVVTRQKSNGVSIFIFTMLIALGMFFFLLLPKAHQFFDTRKAKAAAEAELTGIQDKQMALEKVYADMKNSQTSLDKVKLAIPDSENIPDLYAFMEGLASSVNLKITSIQAASTEQEQGVLGVSDVNVGKTGAVATTPQAAASTAKKGLNELKVNLQLKGNYEDFLNFLLKTQNSLRLIDIQSIDVTGANGDSSGAGASSATDESGSTGLSFTTQFKTYFYKK